LGKIKKDKPKVLTVRLPISLHKEISEAAAADGITLNTYCIYILSKGKLWYNAGQKPCQSLRQKQLKSKSVPKGNQKPK
jgi:hypothetical protein